MDFWIMTAELLLLIAAGVHLRRRKYEFDSLRREYDALEHWAKSWKDSSDTWMNRYREAADQAEMNAAARDTFEAKAAAAEIAREAAELEAERARKECAMHEMERRQLVQKLETLRDEYAKLLSQETDAEMLLRTEMANFLSYTGSEDGQKELRVHDAD